MKVSKNGFILFLQHTILDTQIIPNDDAAESLGYTVGWRAAHVFHVQGPVQSSMTHTFQWIGSPFWTAVWGNSASNLRTDNRAFYEIVDAAPAALQHLSAPAVTDTATDSARVLIYLGGFLRGALAAHGITATVNVTCSAWPTLCYTVQVEDAPGMPATA